MLCSSESMRMLSGKQAHLRTLAWVVAHANNPTTQKAEAEFQFKASLCQYSKTISEIKK